MIKEEYFTPDIEDIRVGYECEKAIPDYSSTGGKPLGWEKHIIGEDFNIEEFDLRGMNTYVLWGTKYLRVPYLTKEQIEAEGWKYYGVKEYLLFGYTTKQSFHNAMEKDNYIIQGRSLFGSQHHLKIFDNSDQEGANCIFEGECKDINTFRYICKLLKI